MGLAERALRPAFDDQNVTTLAFLSSPAAAGRRMTSNVTAASVHSRPTGPADQVRFRSRRTGKVAAIPNTLCVTS
jgi:hypothetical protein